MEVFDIKTKVQFGNDALACLETITASRIFIVTDPFMMESDMIGKITERIKGKDFKIFSNVVPDPPLELVVLGVNEVVEFKPDTLIAVGGGSAIDEAKAIMHFSREIGNLPDMQFIAIPTTSGTGSEVTSFAVITDKDKGMKYPLVNAALLPDVAVLDPSLVKSVPAGIVADTGMDVLTHALEAYVSTKANAFTDALAEKAVRIVFQYLLRSYLNPEDYEARENMHYASCMAGLAFDRTSLGLNHAIAHNIGGKLKIPHGRTNAVLLPYVVEFNADIQDYHQTQYNTAAKKYAALALLQGIPGVNIRSAVKNLIHEIQKLQKAMKMPVTMRDCKIKPDDFHKAEEEIAEGALADACIATNPRAVSRKQILEILKKVL